MDGATDRGREPRRFAGSAVCAADGVDRFRCRASDREPAFRDLFIAGDSRARRAAGRNRRRRHFGRAPRSSFAPRLSSKAICTITRSTPRRSPTLSRISPRYLQDLFHAEDTTVSDWIWKRRLEKSRRYLADLLRAPTALRRSRWPAALLISDISAAATKKHSAHRRAKIARRCAAARINSALT